MAGAAILTDGLEIGLQSIEVLGRILCRFYVSGELGDGSLEVR
jgi:hypothetical protein